MTPWYIHLSSIWFIGCALDFKLTNDTIYRYSQTVRHILALGLTEEQMIYIWMNTQVE